MPENNLPTISTHRLAEEIRIESNKYAEILIESPYLPKAYKKISDINPVIQKGLEIGLLPIQALEQIVFINGKLAIQVDGLTSLVFKSGLIEDLKQYSTGEFPKDEFTCVCEVKRKGIISYHKTEFSIKDAKTAGLWNRPTWKAYPKRMLMKRCYGWALRDMFSDIVQGLYTIEEAQDIEVVYDDDVKQQPVREASKPSLSPPKHKKKQSFRKSNTSPRHKDKILEICNWFEGADYKKIEDLIDGISEKTKQDKGAIIETAFSRKDQFVKHAKEALGI